jgi:hypothetical protein
MTTAGEPGTLYSRAESASTASAAPTSPPFPGIPAIVDGSEAIAYVELQRVKPARHRPAPGAPLSTAAQHPARATALQVLSGRGCPDRSRIAGRPGVKRSGRHTFAISSMVPDVQVIPQHVGPTTEDRRRTADLLSSSCRQLV